MISFYKDRDKKSIDPKLFSEHALHLAESIAESGKDRRGDLRQNKRTQIRKFYDEVLRLNGLVKAEPDQWNAVLPYVNMLIAKTAYAEGRKMVTSDFTAFMKDCIGQIQVPGDLQVFTNFFEAFMGFYRKYGE